MTTNPLRHINSALAISLSATVALESARAGYAAPAPTAEATLTRSIDRPDIKVMTEQANKLRLDRKYAAAADIWQQLLGIYQKLPEADYLNVAVVLNNLAELQARQGNYAAAEVHYLRSIASLEKYFGYDHERLANTLMDLAIVYRDNKQLSRARGVLLRALAIIEKATGGDHHHIAASLLDLGIREYDQKSYANAEILFKRALAVQEETIGPNHLDFANTLILLALCYSNQGLHEKAEEVYAEELLIRERLMGSSHQHLALSLDNLALSLEEQSKFIEAEPVHSRALTIREKHLGRSHADVADNLKRIALNYVAQGRYGEAEKIIQRTLMIRQNELGSNHPKVAMDLQDLAYIQMSQGRLGLAEQNYFQALSIQEQVLGLNHLDLSITLTGMADLHRFRGRHAKARQLYARALEIKKKALDPSSLSIAASLASLGSLYQEEGWLGEAEDLYEQALLILEGSQESRHANLGVLLNNLASLYISQGRHAEARRILGRALSMQANTGSPDHWSVAAILYNLGLLCREEGLYEDADSFYSQALAIYERIFGLMHPDVRLFLGSLAEIYGLQGRDERAMIALGKRLEVEAAWLIRELPILPDQSRFAQLDLLGNSWELPLGWIDRHPRAAKLALETRLNRQGLLAEIEQRQSLLLNAPGVDLEKLEQLQVLTQQLASVSLSPDRRAAVRDQRDRLQAELYRQNPDLQIETVTPAAVAKALPADGVLVEFQRYRPFDGRKPKDERWGKPQYIALVLKPNGSISAVPLGPAAAIDATVHKGLGSSADGLADADGIWGQLSQQVLQPLLPHLRGSRQWFLSPDGELNRVPFAALPAPQQPTMPLAQAVQLRLLTTGRELVRLQQPAPSGSSAVVMANPSYDRPGRKTVTAARPDAVSTVSQRRSGELGSSRWLPLPATEQEGKQVATLLGTRLVGGPAATTTALQRQQGPRVLHVATHGFFIADQEAPPTDPLRMVQEQAPQLKALRGEDPQLRSGLVLAGANQPDLDPNDDGYLTAAEAVSLDLNGTELVVLSACSTGQGEVRTGEGVYGLQRSLTVAGARSTLLSLWKVDDAATAEFMVRFYKRLKAGEGRADALAAVQAEFRSGRVRGPKGEDWSTPYHWAAWQLVGDWRPIQGL